MKKFGLRNVNDLVRISNPISDATWSHFDDDVHDFIDTLNVVGGCCTRGDLISKLCDENNWGIKECSLKVSQICSKLKTLNIIEVTQGEE